MSKACIRRCNDGDIDSASGKPRHAAHSAGGQVEGDAASATQTNERESQRRLMRCLTALQMVFALTTSRLCSDSPLPLGRREACGVGAPHDGPSGSGADLGYKFAVKDTIHDVL